MDCFVYEKYRILITEPEPKEGQKCYTMITNSKEVEAALVKAETLQNAIFNSTHFSSIATDDKGVIQMFNVGAERMLGYSAADVTNKLTPLDIFDRQQLIARAEILSVELDTPIATNFEALVCKANRNIEDIAELTYIHNDGSRFPALVSVTSLRDAQDVIIGYLLVGTNNTAREKADKAYLQLAASVFTHAREGIMITDDTATIIDVNQAFIQITGYSREEAIGQKPSFLQSGKQAPEFYADLWQALLQEGYWYGEIWNRRKNGEVYAVMRTISAVHDEHGMTTHYVSLGNDITRLKEHQYQLEHIAHYDVLTNLPNRVLLADRLSQAMKQCCRHKQSLAVVFLDLDGFKAINDAYGHDVGDKLLIALSVAMKGALRDGDTLARIGGDEFVAVLTDFTDLTTIEDCAPVLERLLLAASKPVSLGALVLKVSASIGVTLYPEDNVDADLLIRHADQAMFVAKESGKNRYHLFDTVQDDAVKVQQESLEAIRSALDHHQFVLHYQPKVNMKTGSVVGVEALIRWQHPERGLLNPIEFLPAIENNPMSLEMGEWVIDRALTQISEWQAMGLKLPLSTSVNIAAVQLQQPDFTQRLTKLLACHTDVNPRFLELEVLETSALDDVHHVSTTMTDCKALGVSFALDDFGTGYSSLTYLRRLPASLIKIDQSFVREMLDDANDLAIVEGVIALAKSFKRDVIAEGVETIEHGTTLLRLGCHLAQGYGIARPMPASDIPAWMIEWKPDDAWQR
jgi:diguanylate cyclase (GGDEF)-like protein/PAS domain S-box-containing protein